MITRITKIADVSDSGLNPMSIMAGRVWNDSVTVDFTGAIASDALLINKDGIEYEASFDIDGGVVIVNRITIQNLSCPNGIFVDVGGRGVASGVPGIWYLGVGQSANITNYDIRQDISITMAVPNEGYVSLLAEI